MTTDLPPPSTEAQHQWLSLMRFTEAVCALCVDIALEPKERRRAQMALVLGMMERQVAKLREILARPEGPLQ